MHIIIFADFFGLNIALSVFMDLMNRVFKTYLYSFVIMFIDNILVYLRSIEELIQYLRIMIQTLRDHRLLTSSLCIFLS